MLNKRQIRWSILLGRYNITLQYQPGKLNERSDALSTREQDPPANAEDARLSTGINSSSNLPLLQKKRLRSLLMLLSLSQAQSPHWKPSLVG
jgi:hypothetical protein